MTISVIAAINSQAATAGAAQFNSALASMRTGVVATSASIGGLTSVIGTLGRAMAGVAIGAAGAAASVAAVGAGLAIVAAGPIIAVGDRFTELFARMGAVAREGESVRATFLELQAAADRSRVPIEDLAKVYNRQANALKDLGYSQREGISIAETLAKVTTISGATSMEARSAMIQLSQALASGKFQGDEFKSVAENLPEVMRILQAETGKTAGELKKLSKEGKITGDTVAAALLNAAASVDQKFSAMPQTAASAMTKLRETVTRTFGTLAVDSKISETFAEIINRFRTLFEGETFKAIAGGVVSLVKQLGDTLLTLGSVVSTTRIAVLALWDALGNTGPARAVGGAMAWAADRFADFKSGVMAYANGVVSTFRANAPEIAKSFDDVVKATTEALDKTRALDSMRRTLAADDPQRGVLGAGGKREVKLGAGEEKQGLIDRLNKATETEREQTAVLKAQLAGNGALARELEIQLAIRRTITDEMSRAKPRESEQLAGEIRARMEAQAALDLKRQTREVDTQALENHKTRAEIAGNTAGVRVLEDELAVRRAVSDEMRANQPDLARRVETLTRERQVLERTKTVQSELTAESTRWAETVFSTLQSGVKEGQKFSQILGNITSKLVDMIVQFAIMKPLAENIGKSVSGFVSSYTGSAAGAAAGSTAGTAGMSSTVAPSGGTFLFAKGDVFTSPVAMAGSGWSGYMAEAGPEAVMPLRRGADGSLGVVAAGGGGGGQSVQNVQNINIHVAGDATDATVERFRTVAREEFARGAPGVVRASVNAVGDTHRRDSSYLRR